MWSKKGEQLFYDNLHLVDIYSNKLARFRFEKEDLYQQGVIGLLEAIKRYDPEKGTFKNYAISYITGHMKLHYQMTEIIKPNRNKWQNKKTVTNLEDDDYFVADSNLEDNYIFGEEKLSLYENIKKLNNSQKLVLKLFLEGNTTDEISQLTGFTKRWIYKLYNQAVQELREMMA